MLIIWITLFVVTFLTILSEHYSKNKVYLNDNGESTIYAKPNKLFFSIVVIVLALLSGLRSTIGDSGYYMYSYKYLTNDYTEIFSQRDWGYTLFQHVLKSIFPDPQFILLVTSFITILCILKTLFKYSQSLSFSLFLLITSGIYIGTMNGLRQYLVAAIIFSAISLIVKKRMWTYFGLVLLLSPIHSSVLIMIPVYFVVTQKAWSKRIFFMIMASLVLYMGFEYLFGFFSVALVATQYGDYLNTFGTETYDGTNIFRIAVAAVPVILGFIYKHVLTNKVENYNIYMNFALINFIVMLFASYNWIFARLGIYFGLFNLLFLPLIIKFAFKGKLRVLVTYIAVVCYIIFLFFEVKSLTYGSYYLNINRDLIGPLTRSLYE